MAYRFLLEVPDTLAEEANVVVSNAGEAQVTVVRDSHGTGFDTPTKDLTISAHDLRVIEAIYKWQADLVHTAPLARQPIRVALNNGRRLSFGDTPFPDMIAAIRRDQPWIERSIPKIGEHETRTDPGGTIIQSEVVPTAVAIAEADAPHPTSGIQILATDEKSAHPTLIIEGVHALHFPVVDLKKPENIYAELFGTEVMARANRNPHGAFDLLDEDEEAELLKHPTLEAEYSFLQNGPLTIALERMGRGYPLEVFRTPPPPIHLLVERESLDRIRANVLMRGFNVFPTQDDSFGFRDPFGYTWQIHHETPRG